MIQENNNQGSQDILFLFEIQDRNQLQIFIQMQIVSENLKMIMITLQQQPKLIEELIVVSKQRWWYKYL